MSEGMNSFVHDSYAEKRKQIRIRIMKGKCLLARAVWGCGVHVVEGSTRHGGAAVAAPDRASLDWGGGNADRGLEAFAGIGLLMHWMADLTLPLKEALRRCPALQAHTTLYYSLIQSLFYGK